MKFAVALCPCKIMLMQTFSVLLIVQQTCSLFFTAPLNYEYPCNDTTDVMMGCEPGLFSDINKFFVQINRNFTANSTVKLCFDSDITVRISSGNDYPEWSTIVLRAGEIMEKRFPAPQTGFSFVLKGTTSGHPNLTSLCINDIEFCTEPIKGLFNKCVKEENFFPEDNEAKAVRRNSVKRDFQCGRRRFLRDDDYPIISTDPITGIGVPQDTGSAADGIANEGDWPWHVAVNVIPMHLFFDLEEGTLFEVYICGGTLISRNFVLTARYCIWLYTDNVAEPEFFFYFIALGRHKTSEDADDNLREKVMRIITPVSNTNSSLIQGIALLKLQSEVQFTDFIRPACLWHRRENDLANENIIGVLAGWGATTDDIYTSDSLQQVNLPIVSRDVCIESFPNYEQFITEKGFCAGYLNKGTAPCYSDIGGALQVFVPDNGTVGKSGTWYVKGIMTRAISKENGKESAEKDACDENAYAIFADEEEFADWIDSNLDA